MDRPYKSTNLRVRAKIDHEINTFSDYFQTIVIKREPTNFKRKKATGYWTVGYFKIKNISNTSKNFGEIGKVMKTILHQFQNGETKGSNILRFLVNFTQERIQPYNNRKSVAWKNAHGHLYKDWWKVTLAKSSG